MELIVDGKNVLKPVNLSENKNEIIQQRESVSSEVELTHFKEKVGLFRATVKGDDLNGLVTELQDTFSGINNRVLNLYDQLDTVFGAVESVHKGSIEGIIVGLKSAQKAIEQAEYAIDQLAETLKVVQEFKNQLECNTEHLNDIDYIWDATQKMLDDITALEDSVNDQFKVINCNIETLTNISAQISETEHFSDIDLMYEAIQKSKKQIEDNKKKTVDNIRKMSSEIDELKSAKETLDKFVHLSDIDELYVGFDEYKKTSSEQISKIDDEIKSIHSIESEISGNLGVLRENFGEYKKSSLKKINEVDDEIESIRSFEAELKGDLNNQNEQIIEIDKDLLEVSELKNEVSLLNSRMKIMWYVLGASIGTLILQIILNIVGII